MPRVKKKSVSMPFAGGLTRYKEGYGGISLEPKHVIFGVIGLIVFEIVLHMGLF